MSLFIRVIAFLRIVSSAFCFEGSDVGQRRVPRGELEYGDPVAIIVVAPYYVNSKLGNITTAVDPSLRIAEVLAKGRYEVRVLIGDGKSEESDAGFKQIAVAVVEINNRLTKENDSRKKDNRKYGPKNQVPMLHPVILSLQRFHTSQDLNGYLESWLDGNFIGNKRAPYGIIGFRGHGESRQRGEVKLGEFFMTPADTPGTGGVAIDSLMNRAYQRRASLEVICDMCRTTQGIPNENKIDRKIDNTQVATIEASEGPRLLDPKDESLPSIFARMRLNRRTIIMSKQYPANAIFACLNNLARFGCALAALC
jgi:hypothetical protein